MRIKVMQDLFAWNFNSIEKPDTEIALAISENIAKIDQAIQDAAPTWPIEKINKIDLSILRLAVYELLIEKNTPSKVVVDEAVELAKEYGSDSSPAFVNGALGKLISDNKIAS